MQRICSIYRSAKVEGMCLYVDKSEGLARVPEALMQRFGRAELAMTLLLNAERKLARVDVELVLQGIAESGFFLQLPPQTAHDALTKQIIDESF
jgi:uncharacterized protein